MYTLPIAVERLSPPLTLSSPPTQPLALSLSETTKLHPLVYILTHVHWFTCQYMWGGRGGREVMGNDGKRIHEKPSKVYRAL